MTTSHLGPGGEARMVDVGDKPVTRAAPWPRSDAAGQLATLMDAGGPKGACVRRGGLAGIGAARGRPT
jgi:hypothetical protein